MFTIHYIIVWNNQAVGLSNININPYKTDDPNDAKFWRDKITAEIFMRDWPEREWKLVPIEFRIRESN